MGPIANFVDPVTKTPLNKDSEGNLYSNLGICFNNYCGSYDFVLERQCLKGEKNHYDKEYSRIDKMQVDMTSVSKLWFDETEPWYKTLLDSLGEISGKRILLLGNGTSIREFYFYQLGADIVFTDLSIEAVRYAKRLFDCYIKNDSQINRVEFHAVNALQLPFSDRSFDVIYGSAFAHHLTDFDCLFREVYRCLDANGKCRFFDQAKSPVWDTMKVTVLKPFQLYSYWKYPRSPEDQRAAHKSPFEYKALKLFKEKHGFKTMYFNKRWFFLGIARRHYGKMVRWSAKDMRKARSLFLFAKRLDQRLENTSFMKKNTLMLIWGFDK